MESSETPLKNLDLPEGTVCIDFVNTVSWRGKQEPEDRFQTFRDLILWGQQVNILSEQNSQTLLRKAAEHPVEAEKVLKQARELREALYRILSSVSRETAPLKKDLALLNKRLSKAMSRVCLVRRQAGFSWGSMDNKETLDWILNPIARSAAEVLVSNEMNRLKTCADPVCGWVFLDKSRNKSRRWCDMKDCGNRAKASRFYKRKRQARSS